MKKINKKARTVKRILFIIIGSILMSFGTYFFLFTADIASGGVGGIALIVNNIFPFLSKGAVTLALNIVLFILGFIVLGREFGVYTIFGAGLYSILFLLYDRIADQVGVIIHDPIINLITGSFLTGAGLAFVFNSNASTGGTDILAKIIDKYFSIGMGTAIMIADSFVIVLAAFTFGIEKAIYGILALMLTSFVLDKILTGFNTLIQMTIISTHIEEINSFITFDLNRGTTLYKTRGGYTGSDREILMTIVGRSQYLKIKSFVNRIDENAFVFINTTSEVIGEGFTREVIVDDSTREKARV